MMNQSISIEFKNLEAKTTTVAQDEKTFDESKKKQHEFKTQKLND